MIRVGPTHQLWPPHAQLKQDGLWAKWMDVAFSKLDSNGDGYISLDEIVSTVPGSDDAGDADNHLIAVSQARRKPSPHPQVQTMKLL